MAKFYLNKAPKSERIKMIGEFYDVVDSLKNREEARLFFRDLLSPDEIAMLIRRVQVATLLEAGLTYRQIESQLKVGKQKIIYVQNSLSRHGEGYDLVIKRLLKKRRKRERKEQKKWADAASSFGQLKSRYPGMFLLFNIIDAVGDWLED